MKTFSQVVLSRIVGSAPDPIYPDLIGRSFVRFFGCLNLCYFLFNVIGRVLNGRVKWLLTGHKTKSLLQARALARSRLKWNYDDRNDDNP